MRSRLITSFVLVAVLLSAIGSVYQVRAADPGDLVINEIMQNPNAVYDSNGEWFELFNPTDSDIDINGWTIKDNDIDSHVIDNGGSLLVPARGYLVLGNNGDSGTNGGVSVDYVFPSSFYLGNSSDELVLVDSSANEIDRVEWDNGATFPDPNGASMALKDPSLDNNVGANWCTASTSYGNGDLGTPGAKNDCPKADDSAFYKTITVVSTNDFHGALIGQVQSFSHGDVVGSADYVAGYLNIVRSENPGGFLYLDAGDSMQGTLISNYFEGASTIDAFNMMGVDAMAIGNHEFDWGQDVLAAREKQAHFPFLAANIFYKTDATRPDWVQPYMVKPVNGIKVGVIGIAHPETPTLTNPVNVDDLDFTDADDAVNDLVDDVEAEGATMVVVLAHIGGYWPDFGELADFVCALEEEEIDLVVAGHAHTRVDDVICGIPVVMAYSSGTAFARVDFTVDKRTGEAVTYDMNPYPVTTYQTYYGDPATYERWDTGEEVVVVPDAAVTAKVARYDKLIGPVRDEVIGYTNAELTRDSCAESVMGDWVTDIMRGYDPSIDFAFTNSGGLRTDLAAGDITYGQLYEVLPFDNTLVLGTVDGPGLKAYLESGVGPTTDPGDYCGGTLNHGIIQVSGLKFNWDSSQPGGSRVSNVRYYDETPVDLTDASTYVIAVNDFMANGGDEYPVLDPGGNTYVVIREYVAQWVRDIGTFDPPTLSDRITNITPP